MDFYAAHLERMVEGYAAIARTCPAGKSHAWTSVQALAKRDPLMWGSLPQLLTQRMKEIEHAGKRL